MVRSAQKKLTREIKLSFSREPWGDSKYREQEQAMVQPSGEELWSEQIASQPLPLSTSLVLFPDMEAW